MKPPLPQPTCTRTRICTRVSLSHSRGPRPVLSHSIRQCHALPSTICFLHICSGPSRTSQKVTSAAELRCLVGVTPLRGSMSGPVGARPPAAAGLGQPKMTRPGPGATLPASWLRHLQTPPPSQTPGFFVSLSSRAGRSTGEFAEP